MYIIGKIVPSTGKVLLSTAPARQDTLTEAQTEADRLASVNPGGEFVIFKPVYSVSKKVVYETISKDWE